MVTRLRLIAVVFVALMAGQAFANSGLPSGTNLNEIRVQQTQLHSEVVGGTGRFKDMNPRARNDLAERQVALLKLIEGKHSLDDLKEGDQVRAFNALESIKATVANSEDERLICERRRPPGSNRIEKYCATVGERRRAQHAALENMAACQGAETCRNK